MLWGAFVAPPVPSGEFWYASLFEVGREAGSCASVFRFSLFFPPFSRVFDYVSLSVACWRQLIGRSACIGYFGLSSPVVSPLLVFFFFFFFFFPFGLLFSVCALGVSAEFAVYVSGSAPAGCP
jgi:hypothetical protein